MREKLPVVSKGILVVVSAFYAYGALVHVLNMFSLSGFDWMQAPLKWQVLDIVYLILDLLVVAGLYRRQRFAVAAFYVAAFSQIILYTVLRTWIMDVPEAYAISSDQNAYLTLLVGFHMVTLVFVSAALRCIPGHARSIT
ncbi:MAG: hypothetical protein ACFHXK_01505 [bacterium]